MANVTKKDICQAIADSTGLTRVDTQIIVEALFDAIRKTMEDGHNIEIRGFGRFKIKPKAARKARNVRTGAPVQVPAGFKLVFQASKELRARVNKKRFPKTGKTVQGHNGGHRDVRPKLQNKTTPSRFWHLNNRHYYTFHDINYITTDTFPGIIYEKNGLSQFTAMEKPFRS